jgi:hypothetical protein
MITTGLVFLLTPSLLAQAGGSTVNTAPIVVGPQLILWTQVQQPQPVPPAVSRQTREAPSLTNTGVRNESPSQSSKIAMEQIGAQVKNNDLDLDNDKQIATRSR